jgi:hypothetical protein
MVKYKLPALHKAIAIFILFFIKLQMLSCQEVAHDSLKVRQIHELENLLHKDVNSAHVWWYGWIGAYGAATLGQGAVYFATDKPALKQDMVLGAATTLLGSVGLLITPLVPRKVSLPYPQAQETGADNHFESIDYYENLLKEIAEREKEGRTFKIHAICGVVNAGSGLITWLGFDRSFKDGVINFALNTAISEAQIWSQPMRAKNDYKRYCEEYNAGKTLATLKPEAEWLVRFYPGGISLELDF